MASGSWEEFFNVHLPPIDYEDNRSLLKEFCERHNQYGNRIVLVTVSQNICFYSFKGLIYFRFTSKMGCIYLLLCNASQWQI